MSTAEKILHGLKDLKEEDQTEVLDFVEVLKSRKHVEKDKEFKDFSLQNAMRGMEDEPDIYDLSDLKDRFK